MDALAGQEACPYHSPDILFVFKMAIQAQQSQVQTV